nr:hypothetical protein [uncultured Chitinophaga sp.]
MSLLISGYYHDAVSGDVIRFFRQGDEDWMEWKGVGWEKLGTWSIVQYPEKTVLTFTYNYAREESFVFTVLALQSGEVTSFRMEDALSRSWDFSWNKNIVR